MIKETEESFTAQTISRLKKAQENVKHQPAMDGVWMDCLWNCSRAERPHYIIHLLQYLNENGNMWIWQLEIFNIFNNI